jgi:putative ABC transport system substrate-binding protein
MRRREFVMLFGGAAAVLFSFAARAQAQAKVWRIGLLETTAAEHNVANVQALMQALRDQGYVEGRNLVVEYRSADGRAERFPDLASELVRLKVDIIVARGTPAALAANKTGASIPVVVTATAEPFTFVKSIARPGGNVTGLSSLVADLYAKRIELLKELLPQLARFGIMTNRSNPNTGRIYEEADKAARSLGLELQILDVRKSEDIEPAFDRASRTQVQGLTVGIDTVTQANAGQIAQLAAKYRLPAVYASREFVEAGGLIAYGVHYPDLYRRAATYIDKILKGTKPAELPIEQPTKFELIINAKAAKALGLAVPPTMLARADEVIE